MTPASLMAEPTLDLAALTGPTIRRHLLGAELRRLRLARSLRLEDAADRLSLAPSTVSRIEAGKAPARTSYVALMLDLYQVQDLGVRRTLTDLAREGRRDIDLVNLTIRIERQLTTTREGERTFGPPKSKAGVRTVSFPRVILPELRDHLTAFVGEDDNALVFTSPTDQPVQHSNFYHRFWIKAVEKEGPPGTHFHDLRHAGNTLTADAGANLRELMDRMGHSTTRAALIYLHSTDDRQRTIADLVDKRTRAELRKINKPSGTKVARPGKQAS